MNDDAGLPVIDDFGLAADLDLPRLKRRQDVVDVDGCIPIARAVAMAAKRLLDPDATTPDTLVHPPAYEDEGIP